MNDDIVIGAYLAKRAGRRILGQKTDVLFLVAVNHRTVDLVGPIHSVVVDRTEEANIAQTVETAVKNYVAALGLSSLENVRLLQKTAARSSAPRNAYGTLGFVRSRMMESNPSTEETKIGICRAAEDLGIPYDFVNSLKGRDAFKAADEFFARMEFPVKNANERNALMVALEIKATGKSTSYNTQIDKLESRKDKLIARQQRSG